MGIPDFGKHADIFFLSRIITNRLKLELERRDHPWFLRTMAVYQTSVHRAASDLSRFDRSMFFKLIKSYSLIIYCQSNHQHIQDL